MLFVFAPVVPVTVNSHDLLPWWSQCGGILGHAQYEGVSVYASLSFAGFQMLFSSVYHVYQGGDFGLVYVLNNGWDTIQFPPIGFGTVMCG